MMRAGELIAAIALLEPEDLDAWIRAEWVAPEPQADDLVFSDRECARIRLICTLRYHLEVEAETLPVVLSLVDQLYETRQRLHALSEAVAAQDPQVRTSVLEVLARMER